MKDDIEKSVVMVVLDGWGLGNEYSGNAIYLANPENFNRMINEYPHTKMKAYGEDVGLPENQMGGSEVGHLSLGAGRVVYQELTAINDKIIRGEFQSNKTLLDAMRNAKEKGKNLHIMGLLSDGGVHSHIAHLYVILDMAKKLGLKNVFIHAFLDGRDVPPRSAMTYIEDLCSKMTEMNIGKIATLSGRYYAMDRDNRWDRVQLAWDAIVNSKGEETNDIAFALSSAYDDGITDEFFLPTVILNEEGKPVASVCDDDSIIFFNFRADRARELTKAFKDESTASLILGQKPSVDFVCLARYFNDSEVPVAFEIGTVTETLGEVISKSGLKQLRIAETEKFAHVTYFFNGGAEMPFENEDRVLIPSLKVATYDLNPEMGAHEIKSAAVEGIRSQKYSFVLVNFANSDMVGHTGKITPTIEAVQVVDECLHEIELACLETGSTLIVTADHGNADEMINQITNKINTAHSLAPVPFIICDKSLMLSSPASFKDIAPTVLDILNIPIPKTMTGRSLIEKRC